MYLPISEVHFIVKEKEGSWLMVMVYVLARAFQKTALGMELLQPRVEHRTAAPACDRYIAVRFKSCAYAFLLHCHEEASSGGSWKPGHSFCTE